MQIMELQRMMIIHVKKKNQTQQRIVFVVVSSFHK